MIHPALQRKYEYNRLWLATFAELDELGPLAAMLPPADLTERIYNAQLRFAAETSWPASAVIRRTVEDHLGSASSRAEALTYDLVSNLSHFVSIQISRPRL